MSTHILHFLDKLRVYENYAQINKRISENKIHKIDILANFHYSKNRTFNLKLFIRVLLKLNTTRAKKLTKNFFIICLKKSNY